MKKTKQKSVEYGCCLHLQSASEITRSQAHWLIRSDTGLFYFDETIEEGSVAIGYPLESPVEFAVTQVFSFGELVWLIAKEYKFIYDTEEKTSTTPVIPPEERGECLNRNKTTGTYGIWGHEFGDLLLERVIIHPDNKIEIFVGS